METCFLFMLLILSVPYNLERPKKVIKKGSQDHLNCECGYYKNNHQVKNSFKLASITYIILIF